MLPPRPRRALRRDPHRRDRRSGELPDQDADLVGAALVGALGEALVGPLSPVAPPSDPTPTPRRQARRLLPALRHRPPGRPCRRSPVAPAAATHEVRNQPPPLTGRDLFADNAAARRGARRARARGWARGAACTPPAAFWGGEPHALGRRRRTSNPPVLHTHDRFGHRRDEVEFHPAWHELMAAGVAHGLHALPWTEPRARRARRARRAATCARSRPRPASAARSR